MYKLRDSNYIDIYATYIEQSLYNVHKYLYAYFVIIHI